MASQRHLWMDFARGICILLVIFLHADPAMSRQGLAVPEAFDLVNRFLDPFRIPFLMLLSGMLLHKSLSKPDRDYVLGKFHLIFWPFLVWSMAVYAAEGRLTWEFVLKTPVTAPSVLWYLWFLCAYYLVALVLVRLRIPLVPVVLVCLVASEVLPSVLRMDRFAALLVFFLLGHLIARGGFSMAGRGRLATLGLVAAVTGGLLSVFYGKIKYDPLFIWAPVGLVGFVLWLAPAYRSSRATAAIEWIGRNSIVFYAAHFPLLIVTSGLLVQAGGRAPAAHYLAIFGIAVVACACLQAVRARHGAP